MAVELLQHPHGRAHISRQSVVVHALLELVRRVGMTKRINRSLLPVPIELNAGLLGDVGEAFLHAVHRLAIDMAKHVLAHFWLAAVQFVTPAFPEEFKAFFDLWNLSDHLT